MFDFCSCSSAAGRAKHCCSSCVPLFQVRVASSSCCQHKL
jgi:hypothetical protein